MPTLEELLADAQLTDDIKIPLPNGKGEVTVGALKAWAASQRSTSEAAKRDYESKAAEAQKARDYAKKLSEDALKLWEAAEAKGNEPPPRKDGDIDWEHDPVYRPINERLTKIEKEQLNAVNEEIKKIHSALGAGLKFVTDNYQQGRWDAIPADQRPKDKTWRDYAADAAKLNLKDQYGLDDPIEAFTRSTAAEREAAKLEAARKKGIEEGRRQAAQTVLPRPGATPPGRKPGDTPVHKTIADALNAAQHDPEIMRIASGEPS